MKVIFATPFTYPFHPYGGIGKYVYSLAKALSDKGIDVEIVASLPEDRSRRETYEDIAYTFLPPYIDWVHPYALLPSLYHLLLSINLASYLRKQNFDILHSYGITPYVYLHLRRRTPVVYQPFERTYDFRGTTIRDNTWWLKTKLVHRMGRYFDVYSITHADAIASEGEFQNSPLAQLLRNNSDRIFNLPVGVDTQFIHRALELRKSPPRDLGLTGNSLVLISVNRLDTPKGIGYLVEAFGLVKREINNCKLILVGTGPEEEKIKSQIVAENLTDSIVHLKNVPEDLLYQYYALSDIYVSPSLEMGSITGILEAMVCGKPVVSTGQDFWVKDGVNGFVVPKRDPQAMAQAILNMYQAGKCKEFGQMSRKIAQDYDYGVIAGIAIKKYEELLVK